MKSSFSRAWAALSFATLSAALLYGQSQRGDYSQVNLGRANQPAPRGQRQGPIYSVEAYGLHKTRLAAGKDRELVEAYCNTCHSLMYITMQPPLPAATWDAEVKKMVQTFGQPIPEDVIPKIIAYLQKHYTPETRTEEKIVPSPAAANKVGPTGKQGRSQPKPAKDH